MSIDASNLALDTRLTPLELSLIADLQRLAQIVRLQGYACRPYSPKSIAAFRTMPLEKKEFIAKQLQNALSVVLMSTQVEQPSSEHRERCYIEPAIKMYGLELRDTEFWNKVQKDDVIEIYSSESIQLFRTFNFFKISSYSLLDLLTLEWYLLWERPSFVMNALIEAAQQMMEGRMKTATQINSSRHILKEIYNDDSIGFKCSSVLVEPGFACPLFEEGSNEVKGFVFSLRGTVLGYDAEVDKLAMI